MSLRMRFQGQGRPDSQREKSVATAEKKERSEPKPPETAHCDFCGKPFHPPTWSSRTCYGCSSKGMPDQGAMAWDAYERVNTALQRGAGTRGLPRGAAKDSLLNRRTRKGVVRKRGRVKA